MSHNIGEKGTVMIEIQNLTKVFQEQTVLQNINATFDAGLIHGVIGKNGAGKTVLLRLLCGLMHPSNAVFFTVPFWISEPQGISVYS